jgi:hypothetical protein
MFNELRMEEVMVVNGGAYPPAEANNTGSNIHLSPAAEKVVATIGVVAYHVAIKPVSDAVLACISDISDIWSGKKH